MGGEGRRKGNVNAKSASLLALGIDRGKGNNKRVVKNGDGVEGR